MAGYLVKEARFEAVSVFLQEKLFCCSEGYCLSYLLVKAFTWKQI